MVHRSSQMRHVAAFIVLISGPHLSQALVSPWCSHRTWTEQPVLFKRRRHQQQQHQQRSHVLLRAAPNNTPSVVPRRRGFILRRITGESTPYQFPRRSLQFQKELLPENPFSDPSDFSRVDPFNDAIFYSLPRLVYHMDEPAIVSITQYYRTDVPSNSSILDLGASWASHYPLDFPTTMKSIRGLGMNYIELKLNDQLTNGFVVYDLNKPRPRIPYDNETFDVITCVATIDYWVYPIQVLQECGRILQPGGKLMISFSNRVFFQKATKLWLDALALIKENSRSPYPTRAATSLLRLTLFQLNW